MKKIFMEEENIISVGDKYRSSHIREGNIFKIVKIKDGSVYYRWMDMDKKKIDNLSIDKFKQWISNSLFVKVKD
jgi:hypothetical protein